MARPWQPFLICGINTMKETSAHFGRPDSAQEKSIISSSWPNYLLNVLLSNCTPVYQISTQVLEGTNHTAVERLCFGGMARQNVETSWIDLDLSFAKQKRKEIPGQRLWKHNRACLLHWTPNSSCVSFHISQLSQIRGIPHGKNPEEGVDTWSNSSITNLELNIFFPQACCHGQDCANNR